MRHFFTFLTLVVSALAVAHLYVLVKFPPFLDITYLSSSSPYGSVAGSTAFTPSVPLSRPLTHLALRVLVIYCLGLAYITPAPGRVKCRYLRFIPSLLFICVICGLPATTVLTAEPPSVFPSIRVRFVFPCRSHRPRRPRSFAATPEKLLANRQSRDPQVP